MVIFGKDVSPVQPPHVVVRDVLVQSISGKDVSPVQYLHVDDNISAEEVSISGKDVRLEQLFHVLLNPPVIILDVSISGKDVSPEQPLHVLDNPLAEETSIVGKDVRLVQSANAIENPVIVAVSIGGNTNNELMPLNVEVKSSATPVKFGVPIDTMPVQYHHTSCSELTPVAARMSSAAGKAVRPEQLFHALTKSVTLEVSAMSKVSKLDKALHISATDVRLLLAVIPISVKVSVTNLTCANDEFARMVTVPDATEVASPAA